jgi:hypothetical protein
MKITFSFQSIKDWSNLEKGEEFLDILNKYELFIEKVGEYEPIRTLYDHKSFPQIWKGRRIGTNNNIIECHFMFKGKNSFKFSGSVSWNKNLHSGSLVVNGLNLHINMPSKFNACNLILLGDELFKWSGAEYGYITEDSKEQVNLVSGNIHTSIAALRWVNYFGSSYLAEPDFHIPDCKVLLHHGARVILAEKLDDEKLGNSEYLDSIKKIFGSEWFWDYPQKHKRRRPLFDTSEITRQ